MAPKKKVECSKTQKNKPWTDKQTNIFVAGLSSTESRDKPFALVLETLALKKTANESVFNNVREEFEDMLVAEGITAASEDYSLLLTNFDRNTNGLKYRPAYFGNTRNRQTRSVFCWLGNHAHLEPVPRHLNPS